MEKLVLGHKSVQAELTKLRLPTGTAVLCDPWIYGRILLRYSAYE